MHCSRAVIVGNAVWLAFVWVLGHQAQVLMLTWKTLCPLGCLPSLWGSNFQTILASCLCNNHDTFFINST